MKYIKFLLPLLLVFGCEEVIEVDLNEAEPALVIEGQITDQEGPYTVSLTKTTSYFESEAPAPASGATVILADNVGNSETLTEVSPGKYQTNDTRGQLGRVYTLSVEADNQLYSATSAMPPRIEIDSLSYRYEDETPFADEGYVVEIHFTDPGGVATYARLVLEVNGEVAAAYYLYDDNLTDGNAVSLPLFQDRLALGDKANVALYTLDEPMYRYFFTLAELVGEGQGPGSAAPSNPTSNLSNDALGYFGAFTVSEDSVLIE